MKRRTAVILSAIVTLLAVFGICFAIGAISGEYEKAGELAGKLLLLVIVVPVIVYYTHGEPPKTGDRAAP